MVFCKSIVKKYNMSHWRRWRRTITRLSFVNPHRNKKKRDRDIAGKQRVRGNDERGNDDISRAPCFCITHKGPRISGDLWIMALVHASVELDKEETITEKCRLFIVLMNEANKTNRSKCWSCEFTIYQFAIKSTVQRSLVRTFSR